MYKTIPSAIPGGQQTSPSVFVPGRLVGFAVNFNFDAPSNASLLMQTEVGTGEVLFNREIFAGNANFAGIKFFPCPGGLPSGGLSYSVSTPVVSSTARAIVYYYEDSPALYP